MRFGFGLFSMLVVVGLAALIFSKYEAPAIEKSQEIKPQVEQISGRDVNGVAAMNSYTAESFGPNYTFTGIKIDTVMAGGPMETYYGLKPGDVVLQINGLDVTSVGDYGSAKGQLDEAFQRSAPLLVNRDGAKMTLPVGGKPGAASGLPSIPGLTGN